MSTETKQQEQQRQQPQLYSMPSDIPSFLPQHSMMLKSAHINKLYPRLSAVQPGTIHQIWIQGEEHLRTNRPHFYESFQEYKRINNGKNLLWTELMIESLIVHEYPSMLTLYHSYSHFIMRVDLAKYIILHYYGGFYVDMDSECKLNFDALTKLTHSDQPLVCKVSDDYRTKLYSKTFINNHFFYLPKRHHPLMTIMVHEAKHTAKRRPLEPMILYILRAIGPGFLMHCLEIYRKEEQERFNQTDSKKLFHKKIKTEDCVTVIESHILNEYFFHESKNTWLEDKWCDEKDNRNADIVLAVIGLTFGLSPIFPLASF